MRVPKVRFVYIYINIYRYILIYILIGRYYFSKVRNSAESTGAHGGVLEGSGKEEGEGCKEGGGQKGAG